MQKITTRIPGVLLILVTLIYTVLVFLPSCSGSSDLNAHGAEEEIVDEYLTDIMNGDWKAAYALTSLDFQENITLDTFTKYFETSGFADNIVEFEIADVVTANNTSNIEVTLTYRKGDKEDTVKAPYPLLLVRQGNKWGIVLREKDFFGIKLDTQSPVAIARNNDISIAIQYLLLYPESTSLFKCRVRMDITNESDKTVVWKFTAGSTDSYIKDNATGEMYLLGPGGGASGKKNGGLRLSKEGVIYKVSAVSGGEGSVFIYFNDIPNTIKQFDMVLGNFSFSDTDETWDITFNDTHFRYDISPQ